MNRARCIRLLMSCAAGLLMTLPGTAHACAACFGQSDSPLAKGMNMGILSLLAVVTFVLGGFVAFFIFLVKRSSLTPMPDEVSQQPEAAKTLPS
jgi:hypothetical protein